MDEISQWFENEFGHLGFTVTSTMYNPDNFSPVKGVLFRHPQVNSGYTFKTNIQISVQLTDDVYHSNFNVETEYKELLTEAVIQFLNIHGLSIEGLKDFKPIKKISKLKL
jgi:hypothetical protein